MEYFWSLLDMLARDCILDGSDDDTYDDIHCRETGSHERRGTVRTTNLVGRGGGFG